MARGINLKMTFGLLTGLFLVAAAHETASAATVSANGNFDISTGSDGVVSEVDTYNLFDPVLGTLTGVTFRWNGFDGSGISTFVGSIGVFAGSEASASATAEITGLIATTISVGGLGIVLDGTGHAMSSCDAPGACSAIASFDESFATSFIVPAGSIAAFIAPGGGTFDVEHSLDATFIATAESTLDDLSQSMQWNGSFTVEYTYDVTPRDVPVPATIGLLGAGLAALGAARWRRV